MGLITPGGAGASGGSFSLITDSVLGAPAASFDTNTLLGGNIPGTFKHLFLVVLGQGSAAATSVNMQLVVNNDTGGNYYRESGQVTGAAPTYGGGEALAAANAFIGAIPAATVGGNKSGMAVAWIPSYTGTTFGKSIAAASGAALGLLTSNILSGFGTYAFYSSSSSVTRLAITLSSGNFIAGSEFSLYGF